MAKTTLMSKPDASLDGNPLPWWQIRSPPPLLSSLATYVVMFVPAITGLLWDWPWLITLALMLPGMIAHETLGFRAGRARGIRRRQDLPSERRVTALVVVIGALAGIAASGLGKRAVPIGIALGLLVVVEPIWRLQWRHHSALLAHRHHDALIHQ